MWREPLSPRDRRNEAAGRAAADSSSPVTEGIEAWTDRFRWRHRLRRSGVPFHRRWRMRPPPLGRTPRQRRLALGVGAGALAVVVGLAALAAVDNGETGGRTPVTAGATVPATGVPEPPLPRSGGDEGAGDLVPPEDWALSWCVALGSFGRLMGDELEALSRLGEPTNEAEARAVLGRLRGSLELLGTLVADLAEDIRDIGTPAVAGGAGIVLDLLADLEDLGGRLADARRALGALEPADLTPEAVAPALEAIGALEARMASLDLDGDLPDLRAAVEAEPACGSAAGHLGVADAGTP